MNNALYKWTNRVSFITFRLEFILHPPYDTKEPLRPLRNNQKKHHIYSQFTCITEDTHEKTVE